MRRRVEYPEPGHVHFITFSCYRRRRLLDPEEAKVIVSEVLNDELTRREAVCVGYVIMPDHVHAFIGPGRTNSVSRLIQFWKQRSSFRMKKLFRGRYTEYASFISLNEPVWQAGFYDFNIFSPDKLHQKLQYIHANPVRRGLVEEPTEWPFSSARYYERDEPSMVSITPFAP